MHSKNREKIIEENNKIRLGLIPHNLSGTVLDLGCADGILSERIKRITNSELVGIDNYPDLYKHAVEKGIKVIDTDINQRLPFDDNTFDLVFAGEIIEHVLSPDEFLLEVKRVLKKDGVLVITTPNLASWHNRMLLLFGFMPYGPEVSTRDASLGLGFLKKIKNPKPAGHIRVFTLLALRDLLIMYGFTVDRVVGCPTDYFPYPFRLFEKIISLFPSLASGIVVRCINKK